jgi:hypothetical protein
MKIFDNKIQKWIVISGLIFVVLYIILVPVRIALAANVVENFYFTHSELDSVRVAHYRLTASAPTLVDDTMFTGDTLAITWVDTADYEIRFLSFWAGEGVTNPISSSKFRKFKVSTPAAEIIAGLSGDSVWLANFEAHDGTAGSFGDSAQGWGTNSLRDSIVLLMDSLMVLHADLDTMSFLAGWAFGAKAYSKYTANKDSIFAVTPAGDTIGRFRYDHPSGVSGQRPDTVNTVRH